MPSFNRRALLTLIGVSTVAGLCAVARPALARDESSPTPAPPAHLFTPPWSQIPDFPLFHDHRELRLKNRATVEKYLSMAGADRIERWRLYTPDCLNMVDGFYEPASQKDSTAGAAGGIELQKKMERSNADGFPDWSFYNNLIFETNDPNLILVEGDGSGLSYLNDKTHPNVHSDHYFHVFRLVDGRIRNYSEIRNELNEIREWGVHPSLPVFGNYEAMYHIEATPDQPYVADYQDDPVMRSRNLRTLRSYLSCSGQNCAQRWKLFVTDGSSGPGYTGDGRILRTRGTEQIRKAEALRAAGFPDWRYFSLIVHQTSDPNYFVAEVNGEGRCEGYADKPFHYREHFYYSFRMSQGKIRDVREYSDPKKWATLTGWDMKLPQRAPDADAGKK